VEKIRKVMILKLVICFYPVNIPLVSFSYAATQLVTLQLF